MQPQQNSGIQGLYEKNQEATLYIGNIDIKIDVTPDPNRLMLRVLI